ncbi:alkaline phosphatase-like protein [Cubamyces sp. BRFM 1775]|nr:alkaline phosphatase-like protein [Cubamyces sp. BRFM 1775]
MTSTPAQGSCWQPLLWRLLLLSVIFHVLALRMAFEGLFTNDIVHGMAQHSQAHAEAKRIVLFVADGLRADLLFAPNSFKKAVAGAPRVVAPHLRSIVENRGAFGVSHARIPTESRHGHIAIIGGVHEDVSDITKGWAATPTNFDSVFNQSAATFAFGAPDILPIFSHRGKVDMWSYAEIQVDPTDEDARILDQWVLGKLRQLFTNSTADSGLDAWLRGDRVVFFLHLGGLDSAGHFHRPFSKEYMAGIQAVDGIVKQVEELMSEFYGDDDTAYIFTSDHGMSLIGTHGDGHPDNTHTPLIAWGKGIRGPLPDRVPSSHDEYSASWELSHLLRRDVEQADISALMSSLLGTNWPVNSVGVLPDVDPTRPGYLQPKEGEETLAQAALVNVQVLLEHYSMKCGMCLHFVKHMLSIEQRRLNSRSDSCEDFAYSAMSRSTEMENLLRDGQYSQVRLQALSLIQDILAGLRHLQTSDRPIITALAVAGYVGWAAYIAVKSTQQKTFSEEPRSTIPILHRVAALATCGCCWAAYIYQSLPPAYYLYAVLPGYFWFSVVADAKPSLWRLYERGSLLRGALVIAALESMVIGYTYRIVWSIWSIVIGTVWPAVSFPRALLFARRRLSLAWMTCCLVSAVFPLLDDHQEQSIAAIMAGALLMGVVGLGILRTMRQINDRERRRVRIITCWLLFQLALSATLVGLIIRHLETKTHVPSYYRSVGWFSFVSTVVTPLVVSLVLRDLQSRLLSVFLGFGAFFIWLAIRAEGLFYVVYSLTLLLWVEMESALRSFQLQRTIVSTTNQSRTRANSQLHHPQAEDLRIAVFFVFFSQVAFFGAGNAFYLAPVYRLVPVFKYDLMTALLVLKIFAPYMILGTATSLLNARLGLAPFRVLLVALPLQAVMLLTLFLNITDAGSWHLIGHRLSCFCACTFLLLFSEGACIAGELLMLGHARCDRDAVPEFDDAMQAY